MNDVRKITWNSHIYVYISSTESFIPVLETFLYRYNINTPLLKTMDLNLTSLIYLFFRLSPFILVCFFTLGSIINGELKGFVYLVGLIFTCFMGVTLVGAVGNGPSESVPAICNLYSVNGIVANKTPLSLVILAYTFFYLVYPIGKYKLAIDNVPMLIFFPILILAEAFWLISKNCFNPLSCFLAFIVGGGLGVAWSAIIDATKLRGLQYYSIGSNRERCSMASKQKFVCKTYDRNGNLISTTA